MLVNVLALLFPILAITILIITINISTLKEELRNTEGLNYKLESNVTDQAYEIRKLNMKLHEIDQENTSGLD